jgi:hypothetical protein
VARCGDALHNSEAGGQIQPVLWGRGDCITRMRSTSGRLPLSSRRRGAPPCFSLEHDGDQASTSSTGRGHAFVVRCCDLEPRARPRRRPPPLLRLRLPACDHGKRRGGDDDSLDLGGCGDGDGLDLGPMGLGLGGNFFICENCFFYRSGMGDTLNWLFLVSCKGYRLKEPTRKMVYQPTLKTIFVLV